MTKIGNALIEKGIQKGIEKGIEEGIERGSMDAKKSAAIKMFELGDSIEKIAAVLTLSSEMVQKWLIEANVQNIVIANK